MVVVLVAVVEVYSPPEYFLPDYFAISNSDSNSSSNHFALLVLVSWKPSSSSNHLALLFLLLFLIIQVDYYITSDAAAWPLLLLEYNSLLVLLYGSCTVFYLAGAHLQYFNLPYLVNKTIDCWKSRWFTRGKLAASASSEIEPSSSILMCSCISASSKLQHNADGCYWWSEFYASICTYSLTMVRNESYLFFLNNIRSIDWLIDLFEWIESIDNGMKTNQCYQDNVRGMMREE